MTTTKSYFMRPLALLVWAVLAASVMVVMLASQAQALTYTVTNTNDAGAGSLRQAINDANTNPGADTINFDLEDSPATISLFTPFFGTPGLAVTDGAGLTIDGGNADITISGNGRGQVFYVAPGAGLTLNDLTVANGFADRKGGGILNDGGMVTVSNSTISGSSTLAGGEGAGIFSQRAVGYAGTLEVSNSTISGNSAGGNGGGIFSAQVGSLDVTNSTISGNSADGDGGGIYHDGPGPLRMRNSTISGNSAGGNGGGIYNNNFLAMFNSTVSENGATNLGGGIYSAAHTELRNTLVANSTSGGNCTGSILDVGYNLDSDGSCGFGTTNHSLSGVDPVLGPLADNSGPTQTHALQEGSPAIDQGNSFTATTDQRGKVRPSDFFTIPNASDGSDIGAFELQAPPDTSAPSVTCGVTPNKLSLPTNNHKLVTVNATVEVKDDNGSGPDGFKLVSVMSNQKDSGLAKDDVPNDIQDWAYGSPDVTGKLRAERYGADRVYTLNYEGYDKAGNKATCSATVTVPKKGG
jgi:predicted outer membrane repeat protein